MKVCSTCGFKGADKLFIKNRNQCRGCRVDRDKRHRERKKEYYRVYGADYYQANKEAIQATSAKHYQDNRQHIDDKAKQWRKDNPVRKKEIQDAANLRFKPHQAAWHRNKYQLEKLKLSDWYIKKVRKGATVELFPVYRLIIQIQNLVNG